MYKVTNKLEASVRYKNTIFGPKETKLLEEAPTSDKFIVEKVESKKSEKNDKGGK